MAESERQRRAVEAALAAEDRAEPTSTPQAAPKPVATAPPEKAIKRPTDSPTSFILVGFLALVAGSALVAIGGSLLGGGDDTVGW